MKNEVVLFSESNTRFIAEVKKADKKRFEKVMKGAEIGLIGEVTNQKSFIVYGLENKKIIDINIEKLKEAWQKPLRW